MKLLQQAVEQYQTNMVGKLFPPCFGKQDHWSAWLHHEQEAKTEPRGFACRDCTKRFQEMCINNNTCLIPDISVEYVVRERD